MPKIGSSTEPTPAAAPSGDPGSQPWGRLRHRDGALSSGVRDLAEETPVAMVYDGATQAVLMATPCDLEDFAVGFSLNEGVVASADEIADLEIVEAPQGVEVRMWLTPAPRSALAQRRRRLAGPTGCGLCGIDSLAEAVRPVARVQAALAVTPAQIALAQQALTATQHLGARTRAVHAAGFWTPADGLIAGREDVGRHNALDKLGGAIARRGVLATDGAVLLTSRVSVEMVQKTAVIGAGVLIAVSAPTTLATATADAAGITLVAVARPDGFEVFTHPHRIVA